MKRYLDTYLDSIPNSEVNKIIDYLKKRIASENYVSEDNIDDILSDLIDKCIPASSKVIVNTNEKPRDTYNKFYPNVSIDLAYLYRIIDATNNVLSTYSNLSNTYFSDIKSQIEKLQTYIYDLETKYNYENNSIVFSEDFKTTDNVEDDLSLYKDIDGKVLPKSYFNIKDHQTMITLEPITNDNLLLNNNGKPMCKVFVMDNRGKPCKDINLNTQNVTDKYDYTVWDLTSTSLYPLDVPLDNITTGGAITKFKVILSNTRHISEITISPSTIYPMTIYKILLNDINILTEPKDINETFTINFDAIATDEIVFVVGQKNYILSNRVYNSKLDNIDKLYKRNVNKEDFDINLIDDDKIDIDISKYLKERRNL